MSFVTLPPELRKKVFNFLTWADLCQAALVCKTWRTECENPSMWENFPLKLTLDNCGTFLTTERFALTKTLEMELPGCNLPGCESHTETEWPILNEVFEFMKSSLKEAVFLLSNCQGGYNNLFWIERFAMEKSKGVNVCTLWAPNQKDDFKLISYYWGESSTAASLIDLIKRTLAGERQAISIWSKGGSAQRALPDTLFEVFGNQTPEPLFYFLQTNLKIKSLGNTLDHLSLCKGLFLYNKAPIEPEEVEAMNRLLAYVAGEPRPKNLLEIRIPKALFLRTSWADSQMLRESNLVADCTDTPDTDCCDGGCISIEAFEDGSDEWETESDTESD